MWRTSAVSVSDPSRRSDIMPVVLCWRRSVSNATSSTCTATGSWRCPKILPGMSPALRRRLAFFPNTSRLLTTSSVSSAMCIYFLSTLLCMYILFPARLKERQEFVCCQRVQHITGAQPPLASDTYTIPYHVKPINTMSIRVNWNLYTLITSAVQKTPIQIEARWMSIDLDTRAMLRRRVNDRLDINIVALAAEQEPSGRMSNNIHEGIGDGANHALRLLLTREVKLAVNRSHHEIQASQRLVGKVERAIAQDVALGSMQDVNTPGKLLVEAVDFLALVEKGVLV